MYAKGTSVSEVAAILRIVPYNLTAALLVLVGGIAGGRVQDVVWPFAALLSGTVHEHEGFVIQARHLRRAARAGDHRRLGESIVVIGLESGRVRSISSSCSSCCRRSRSARRSGGSTSAMRRPSSRHGRCAGVAPRGSPSGSATGTTVCCSGWSRRRGPEEGGRRSLRPARYVDRKRARPRCRPRRLHGRVCGRARARLSPRANRRCGSSHWRRFPSAPRTAAGEIAALTAIVVGALVLEAGRPASSS